MDPKSIYERLKAQFGEAMISFDEPPPVPVDKKDSPETIEYKKKLDQKRKLDDSFSKVKVESIVEVARFLKDSDLKMDFLMCLSGVDTKGPLQVVYHFYSYPLGHKFAIKV